MRTHASSVLSQIHDIGIRMEDGTVFIFPNTQVISAEVHANWSEEYPDSGSFYIPPPRVTLDLSLRIEKFYQQMMDEQTPELPARKELPG